VTGGRRDEASDRREEGRGSDRRVEVTGRRRDDKRDMRVEVTGGRRDEASDRMEEGRGK
jgi:hypothetical protein